MPGPSQLYRPSLALLTDLYQLTMAHGFWKTGRTELQGCFTLFSRKNPFGGGYSLACGLSDALDFLSHWHFEAEDLAFLAGLKGNDDQALFEPAFLDYLGAMELSVDVDAVPEGTVTFPLEPMARVRGPVTQCQLLETALLNFFNFQTLIATKAARVCTAAGDDPVLEFGLRRAQGIDGGLSATRAAYIGGVAATSNVLAGKLYGIPVKGTHAHSWVLCFDDELSAFRAYAEAMPNNCVLLVDTYNTRQGIANAIEIGRMLRDKGHDLTGIRLDSGDLAYLSVEARRMLDDAGFEKTLIIGSNDLDERIIGSLKGQGATIGVWGVGTRLITAHQDPSLGGVYKLTAIRPPGSDWQHKVKVSEHAFKTSTPGVLQVRRYSDDKGMVADAIWDELTGIPETCTIVDPLDSTRRRILQGTYRSEDLLIPVMRSGKQVYDSPPLDQVRQRAKQQISSLHPGITRFVNPHSYPVGLESGLFDLKTRLVLAARELGKQEGPPQANG